MYAFRGMLDDKNRDVVFKKEQLTDCWLYSFYDRKKAAKEEADYFKHHKGQPFDARAMQESDERFGTIVFESDLDTDPMIIYKMYDERWLIEESFRYYKKCYGLRRYKGPFGLLGVWKRVRELHLLGDDRSAP